MNDGRHLDPLVTALFTAIAARGYTPQEWAWIERIKRRYRTLADLTETVVYTDYGAGSPDDARSAEQMRLGVPSQQSVGQLTRAASKDPKWAGLLLRILRETRPLRCVEMGAAAGISASYQAAALRLNGAGRLVTLEGSEAVAELAADTLKNLGLDDVAEVVVGRFQDSLEPALRGGVDYMFVDGHHDRDATIGYFDAIAAATERAVVVLDDIDWSPGMVEAWRYVSRSGGVAAAFDLGRVGVCVINWGGSERPLYCTVDYG